MSLTTTDPGRAITVTPSSALALIASATAAGGVGFRRKRLRLALRAGFGSRREGRCPTSPSCPEPEAVEFKPMRRFA